LKVIKTTVNPAPAPTHEVVLRDHTTMQAVFDFGVLIALYEWI
jgi:hypothetical protein